MGRREDNKRDKRERLLVAGLRSFLEAGYDRTTIEAIAAAAGVARGTFYLYFPDKLAVFTVLMSRWVDPVGAVLSTVQASVGECDTPAEVRTVYEEMGAALAVIGLTNSDPVLVGFRESRQLGDAGRWLREVELEFLAGATRFTEDAARRGLIRVADPRLAVLVVFGAIERLFYEVLVGTDLGEPDAAAQAVVGLFGTTMGFGGD
ncbi:MAG: AcrR family transcriptional regulator [Myxococcota bacterium]